MKKITLLIDDDVYDKLKTGQGIKIMMDDSGGIQDSFVKKIISSIENGEKEIELKFKK